MCTAISIYLVNEIDRHALKTSTLSKFSSFVLMKDSFFFIVIFIFFFTLLNLNLGCITVRFKS